MAFRSFSLRYGKSQVSFELPEDQISTVITGKEVKAIDNLEDSLSPQPGPPHRFRPAPLHGQTR